MNNWVGYLYGIISVGLCIIPGFILVLGIEKHQKEERNNERYYEDSYYDGE